MSQIWWHIPLVPVLKTSLVYKRVVTHRNPVLKRPSQSNFGEWYVAVCRIIFVYILINLLSSIFLKTLFSTVLPSRVYWRWALYFLSIYFYVFLVYHSSAFMFFHQFHHVLMGAYIVSLRLGSLCSLTFLLKHCIALLDLSLAS